jgi:hypothetical protein
MKKKAPPLFLISPNQLQIRIIRVNRRPSEATPKFDLSYITIVRLTAPPEAKVLWEDSDRA